MGTPLEIPFEACVGVRRCGMNELSESREGTACIRFLIGEVRKEKREQESPLARKDGFLDSFGCH